nr:hypothetical protein [uncultured Chryseobacterium sp.]
MKKRSFLSSRNIELLPVLIPIILSLSSWTIYKVIQKDYHVVKTVKYSNQNSNPFRINCDFLKQVKSHEKLEVKSEDFSAEASVTGMVDSVSMDLPASGRKTFMDQPGTVFNKLQSFPTSLNSSLINSGYIGEIGSKDSQRGDGNASDNIFDVQLPAVDPEKSYILSYEVDGYSDLNSVTRSVNGSFAIGGYIRHKQTGWTLVSEPLDPLLLKKGENKILFNAISKGDYYTIKNVKIAEKQNSSSLPYTVISKIYNDKITYIRGFVNPKSGIRSLEIDGETIDLKGKEFEFVSYKKFDKKSVTVKFNGTKTIAEMVVEKATDGASFTEISSYETKGHTVIYQNASGTVKGLRMIDLPPVDLSIDNVSNGYSGFRFDNNTSKETLLIRISFLKVIRKRTLRPLLLIIIKKNGLRLP